MACSCTFPRSEKASHITLGNVFVFQDPSVASHTSNAARGLEDFNPFADQNTSQASGAAKVVHFY